MYISNERRRNLILENKHGAIKPPPPKYFCTKCRTKKTKNDFRLDRHYTNGHSTWCKKCASEYQKQYSKGWKTGCWYVDTYIEISLTENRRIQK